MSGMSPSPADSKPVGRHFGDQLGSLLMGQWRLGLELCASLLEMEQLELALYALRQGFAHMNISHVELRDKHRVGILLFDRLEMLPLPVIPTHADAWTRRLRFLGSVELDVLRVGLPVKKLAELARDALQSPRNYTSDQEASSRHAV